jgi:hypothetical protein
MVKPPPDSVPVGEWLVETRPIASGFEPTMPEAEARAAATAGADSVQDRAQFASGYLGRLVAEKRMVKESRSDDASPIEFVWEADYYVSDYPSDEFDGWRFTPYRVVRKSARRVYVDRERYWEVVGAPDQKRQWYDYPVVSRFYSTNSIHATT